MSSKGRLPDGWHVTAVSGIGKLKDGDWILASDYAESGVRLLQVGDIGVGRFIGKSTRYIDHQRAMDLNCTFLKAGDILISRMPDPIGRACVMPYLRYPAISAVDISIWQPDSSVADRNYLAQYVNSPMWFRQVRALESGATRLRISRTNLETLDIPLPPLPEQRKIAEILGSVDGNIENTQALIAKLQDLKKATMQELLTKGIGHTKFKDSPVGRIPEEWEVCRFAKVGSVIDGDRGTNYPSQHEFSPNGFCLFLNAGNVTKSGFRFDECAFVSSEKDALLRKGRLKRDDIVLTTRGSVGNLAYYDESVHYDNIRINSGMVILRNESKSVDTAFLYRQLQSPLIGLQIEQSKYGSAQQALTVEVIKTIAIVVPTLFEQRTISDAICSIEKTIESNYMVLNRLNDLKKALMQDLLTGRVRVKA